ncbi:MAG TPA: DUF4350 domain-containing protein [Bryobacteraceae bacterium]|nr:DUF4350 domain-containing protein [Bryobacteraceae bacterium]
MTLPPRRILTGVLVAAALLLTLLSPNVRRSAAGLAHPDPVGPTTYSKSALGHAAVYRLLATLDIPVAVSEAGSGAHLAPGNVLVIGEPRADETTLEEVRAMLTAETVLLVLPKHAGKADPKRPNWIGEDQLVPESTVTKLLRLVDPSGVVLRPGPAASWASSLGAGTPAIRSPQVFRSARLQPLLASNAGMLMGERREHGRRLIVLSDPDLIENHSLDRGDNAVLAVSMIERLRAGRDGTVIFDEFVHGFSPHAFHLLGILFQFPFVLVTIQMGLAVALMAWAATARFGVPATVEPPIAAGKRSLIEAGARLLDRWGHPEPLAESYFNAMVRDAGRELRAPRGLDVPGLLDWFAKTGRPAPAAAGKSQAQQVYTWRKELTGGSSNYAQRR